MSKKSANSRKAVKRVASVIKDNKECQTDNLLTSLAEIIIADNNTPTTSKDCSVQELSKEQLITRLACSQSLCKRLKALFVKERQLRKDEQQKFQTFFQQIKVILYDSRHSYNIVKQDLADSAILFVNGREALRQKMEAYQQKCQTELRSMRDQIARNDVVIEKTNLTIVSTKKDVEKALKISDETRKKIQKAALDKGFIETQYKALVKKQNEKYFSVGEYCPKCNAIQSGLKEFTDSIDKLKSDVKRLEKECQTATTQKASIETELKALQKKHEKVVYERDIYKQDDKTLREQLAKAKKALSDTTNSPNRNAKLLDMLNSPARLENSPILAKETPPPPAKLPEKSPTPPEKILGEKSNEPPPKKRTNGTSLSREEGEVTPEDETSKSPPIKPETTRTPPLIGQKRPFSTNPPKPQKPKQMDYVYVINDRQKPSDRIPKSDPRPLLQKEVHPPGGYEPRPRPRHQSPPFRFDSHPSHSAYYDDYQMMGGGGRGRPAAPYHVTPAAAPPYHQQRQMPPNGYPSSSSYSPQYPPAYQHHPSQQQSQHPPSQPSYYRPAANTGGGAAAPWHVVDRSQQPQYPHHQQQQRPPGESWTAWR